MKRTLRVLVAEDEYVILMGLRASLEELGHQVVAEAGTGEQAVEMALEHMPDLILMDINLPGIDGIEAIRRISGSLLVPSIIITGYSRRDLIDEASSAGVFAYLVKPIDSRDLQPAIDVALARFRELVAARTELDETKEALAERKLIERAKGILMDRWGLKESEAMQALRDESTNRNIRLVLAARKVIDRERRSRRS